MISHDGTGRNEKGTSRRRVVLGGAAVAMTCLRPFRAAAQCDPGDTLWDETETQYICRPASPTDLPACSTVPDSAEAIGRQRDSLRSQLQLNSREAARNADELETWSAFLSTQRHEARKKAAGQAGGIVLNATLDKLAAAGKHLGTLRAEEAGLMRREWGAILGRLSRMTPAERDFWLGRIQEAKTVEQGMIVLKGGIEAINTSYDIGALAYDNNWQELQSALLGACNIAVKIAAFNPAIGMLKADFEAGENALYGWWSVLAARNRLQQFCALEDQLLAQQVHQSNRYILLSNALKAIKTGQTYCLP